MDHCLKQLYLQEKKTQLTFSECYEITVMFHIIYFKNEKPWLTYLRNYMQGPNNRVTSNFFLLADFDSFFVKETDRLSNYEG